MTGRRADHGMQTGPMQMKGMVKEVANTVVTAVGGDGGGDGGHEERIRLRAEFLELGSEHFRTQLRAKTCPAPRRPRSSSRSPRPELPSIAPSPHAMVTPNPQIVRI